MAKDYYSILGVPRTATEAEIKQAYRKLSRELHPDKHSGNKEKEAKFKEVNEAYTVLSDPKKKDAYDRFGSADAAGVGDGFSGFSGFSGFDPSQFGGENFADIFETFFSGGRRRPSTADKRGHTIETEIFISFAEAVSGTEREISVKTEVKCPVCGGSGAETGAKQKTCDQCGGTGAVTRSTSSLFGTIRQTVLCPQCQGSGKVPEHPCKHCEGEGRVPEKKTVTVRVPAGIDDGQTLRVTGAGEAGRQGAGSGDLLVLIRVEDDPRFERDGDDVRTAVSIPVADAVLGGRAKIDSVHGELELNIPAGTQPGDVLRLKGKGMPVLNTSRFGDQYVTIKIEIPKKLSREEKRLFEELRGSP
ncbi:molecular chaperone DnaJ [Candidatus Peribacteria bacterium RIFCSPLOWO2_01_FULL_51_18]|nr:MAG: molecular chaperone DnaJ [Candidatus Peribacteria bacterium RIFCSPLOWO2_01_FULL_51_18]